jgi:hypothetical protein
MNFEEFLAATRKRNPISWFRKRNVEDAELRKHLDVIGEWEAGNINRRKMLDTLEFMDREFDHEFRAKDGLKLYRGQVIPKFDGLPASYSRQRYVALAFAANEACAHEGEQALLVSRKSRGISLDLSKLTMHKVLYPEEYEVILLNSEPKRSEIDRVLASCSIFGNEAQLAGKYA